MLHLREPCERRPVRCLELWEPAGWRLKVYGIAYNRPAPRPKLVAGAKALAAQLLPTPALTESRYGVGFIGVHDGRGANFVFLCWWSNENELHHLVYHSPPDELTSFTEQVSDGGKACVWDLAVIGFERQAWLDCVLRNPAGPNLDAYLDQRMNAEV